MEITRENLVAHELVGLNVEVLSSPDPTLLGVSGEVVYETKNTIHVLSKGRSKVLPKKNVSLKVRLPSSEDALLDGSLIVGRPEDRIAKLGVRRK